MKIETLEEAKKSLHVICENRKESLICLLIALNTFADGSLSPEEHEQYEKIKTILIERHSQHNDLNSPLINLC